MLGIGTWFGRGQQSTKDFFFGGQRFSWWLISFSLVATTIGSYSFVKYSKVAYNYGIASSQTYLNDWFWVPLMLFGWLPILYFTRLVSIPEYFEKRLAGERRIATWLLLVYLIGYVGSTSSPWVRRSTSCSAGRCSLAQPVWRPSLRCM